MSRTDRRAPYRWFAKEDAQHRREWRRRQRHAAKIAIQTGSERPTDLANVDQRKTSGWLTW